MKIRTGVGSKQLRNNVGIQVTEYKLHKSDLLEVAGELGMKTIKYRKSQGLLGKLGIQSRTG